MCELNDPQLSPESPSPFQTKQTTLTYNKRKKKRKMSAK